ncbi:MAG: ABC transporter ATP-binding protein [Gammaproteobacteria bacterium]|nr:ABC transporter ATP-binding protein [Gammaproteobacteria bacterium]
MIELRDAGKSYRFGEVVLPVLKGLSLHIEAGEFVAIMGPSGSGKSTLLNVIGCLDTVDQGSYRLDGVTIEAASEDELAALRNARLGFVFQSFNLIPRINALRNVELPMVYHRVAPAERQRRAYAALKRVGLEGRATHSPARLSGGQQQRVAIARALINDPDIIIADEPTGSLDSVSGHDIMRLFSNLHQQGKTIVMVTHEEEIATYARRVIRLRDGVIEKDERR